MLQATGTHTMTSPFFGAREREREGNIYFFVLTPFLGRGDTEFDPEKYLEVFGDISSGQQSELILFLCRRFLLEKPVLQRIWLLLPRKIIACLSRYVNTLDATHVLARIGCAFYTSLARDPEIIDAVVRSGRYQAPVYMGLLLMTCICHRGDSLPGVLTEADISTGASMVTVMIKVIYTVSRAMASIQAIAWGEMFMEKASLVARIAMTIAYFSYPKHISCIMTDIQKIFPDTPQPTGSVLSQPFLCGVFSDRVLHNYMQWIDRTCKHETGLRQFVSPMLMEVPRACIENNYGLTFYIFTSMFGDGIDFFRLHAMGTQEYMRTRDTLKSAETSTENAFCVGTYRRWIGELARGAKRRLRF